MRVILSTLYTASTRRPRALMGTLPRRPRDSPAAGSRHRVAAWGRRLATWGPDLTDPRRHLVDNLAQHAGRLLNAHTLLLRQRQLDLLPRSTAADHRGHRQAYVTDAVKALLQRAHWQHPAAISCQRFHHFTDRQADCEAG